MEWPSISLGYGKASIIETGKKETEMTKRFEVALAAYMATIPAARAEAGRKAKWDASRDLVAAIRQAHTLAKKGKISADAYAALEARYDTAIRTQ